jgi:hypothetical protein
MTLRPERRLMNKIFLGVATAVLIPATIFLLKNTWATKVDVGDFNLHVATEDRRQADYKLDRQLDSVWHAQQAVKMDEVLCTLKPTRRSCPKD